MLEAKSLETCVGGDDTARAKFEGAGKGLDFTMVYTILCSPWCMLLVSRTFRIIRIMEKCHSTRSCLPLLHFTVSSYLGS